MATKKPWLGLNEPSQEDAVVSSRAFFLVNHISALVTESQMSVSFTKRIIGSTGFSFEYPWPMCQCDAVRWLRFVKPSSATLLHLGNCWSEAYGSVGKRWEASSARSKLLRNGTPHLLTMSSEEELLEAKGIESASPGSAPLFAHEVCCSLTTTIAAITFP